MLAEKYWWFCKCDPLCLKLVISILYNLKKFGNCCSIFYSSLLVHFAVPLFLSHVCTYWFSCYAYVGVFFLSSFGWAGFHLMSILFVDATGWLCFTGKCLCHLIFSNLPGCDLSFLFRLWSSSFGMKRIFSLFCVTLCCDCAS